MSDEQQLTSMNLVQQCIDGDAVKAADTLSALLGPKLVDAIQTKKQEVAQSMFSAPEQPSAQDGEQEQEDTDQSTEDSLEQESEVAATADEAEEEHEDA